MDAKHDFSYIVTVWPACQRATAEERPPMSAPTIMMSRGLELRRLVAVIDVGVREVEERWEVGWRGRSVLLGKNVGAVICEIDERDKR